MQKAPLLAPTYLDQGRLMIPVASVDGNGSLPYATVHYDVAAGTVAMITVADWPGNALPRALSEAQLKFVQTPESIDLQPGISGYLPTPELVDTQGNRIAPVDPDHFTTHIAVDPASPVRLRVGADGPLLTDLNLGRPSTGIDAVLAVDESVTPIPEGTWNLTYTVAGLAPVTFPVTVSDHRPAKLGVTVGPASVGQTQTISDLENAGPAVTVTLPDNSTAQATPAVHTDPDMGRPFILVHGVATFTFTPSAPGPYHYAAHLHTPYSSRPAYGDFDAAADFTVNP